ncbi:unnamed protein product [Symbiodinium sp. CCMP2592]|nr:unnamed protein product [Symbiodinium sp. CCMP2592]
MELVPVHGSNKMPRWSVRLHQPSALETFVENCLLGQLTWQWLGLELSETRRRKARLRERWESVGAFKMWFDAWRLLDGQGRIIVLDRTLGYDRQFGLAMLQAVYLFQDGFLHTMD